MWKITSRIKRESLKVIIISCGDSGIAIGAGIIKNLKDHKVKVNGLAITTEFEESDSSELFDETFRIEGSRDGFAKNFEAAYESAKSDETKITTRLRKLLGKSFEGLVLVTTGSGATGLGATLVTLQILASSFDLHPPVITLLPEIFENSRVQYNAATFLYEVVYKEDGLNNPVLILDNRPALDEMELEFSEVSRKRIESIPDALGDLLIASFEKSVSDEFDANVADLFTVMHTAGISVFVSENLGDESGNVDSARIEDVISDSVIDTTNLTKDKIFEAKNAFISIFNIDQTGGKLSFQTEFETQKLFREFRNSNPHVKFVSMKDHGKQTKTPKLRAIIAGLPVPTRILQIMRIAQESRKRVMLKENMLANKVVQLDVDQVTKLEDQIQKYFS